MTAIHDRTKGSHESVPKPPPGHSETCCNGQAHGQGVLPLGWADTRTKEQKADDHFDMLAEKARDRYSD